MFSTVMSGLYSDEWTVFSTVRSGLYSEEWTVFSTVMSGLIVVPPADASECC